MPDMSSSVNASDRLDAPTVRGIVERLLWIKI